MVKIILEMYSEKSFVLRGEDINIYSTEISKLGGKWNSSLTDKKTMEKFGAWIFSLTKKAVIEKWLNSVKNEPLGKTLIPSENTHKKDKDIDINQILLRIERMEKELLELKLCVKNFHPEHNTEEKNQLPDFDDDEDDGTIIPRLL